MMGGVGLNIAFSILITLLIYLITKELINNNIMSILLSIVWSISLGNITFVAFIRMYVMFTFFMLAITFLHIKYISKKRNILFYLGVFLLSILGTLTQYYFLIYLFFLCVVFSIHLLLKKNFKATFFYIITLSAAGITCIGIFPAMLHHIFGGYRGKESFQNIGNASDLTERFKGFY